MKEVETAVLASPESYVQELQCILCEGSVHKSRGDNVVLGPGSGGVGWFYVCVSCESGFSV